MLALPPQSCHTWNPYSPMTSAIVVLCVMFIAVPIRTHADILVRLDPGPSCSWWGREYRCRQTIQCLLGICDRRLRRRSTRPRQMTAACLELVFTVGRKPLLCCMHCRIILIDYVTRIHVPTVLQSCTCMQQMVSPLKLLRTETANASVKAPVFARFVDPA